MILDSKEKCLIFFKIGKLRILDIENLKIAFLGFMTFFWVKRNVILREILLFNVLNVLDTNKFF